MKKYYIKNTGDAVSLPAVPLFERFADASELDLRVIIAVAAAGEGGMDEQSAAEMIGCTEEEISASVAFWRGAGAIAAQKPRVKPVPEDKKDTKTDSPPEGDTEKKEIVLPDTAKPHKVRSAEKMPEYTGDRLDEMIKEQGDLAALIDAAQQTLGKMFSPAEINIIVGMRDYLALDDEYILMLLAHCAEKGKKSLKYLEKTAFALCDEGVDSAHLLEEHLRRAETLSGSEGKLRRMLGIGERTLSANERKTFSHWMNELSMPDELIGKSYEITVDRLGKASLQYMNAILEKWHSGGIKTLEEAEEEASHGHTPGAAGGAGGAKGSFDTDDFFEAALNRSMKNGKGKDPESRG